MLTKPLPNNGFLFSFLSAGLWINVNTRRPSFDIFIRTSVQQQYIPLYQDASGRCHCCCKPLTSINFNFLELFYKPPFFHPFGEEPLILHGFPYPHIPAFLLNISSSSPVSSTNVASKEKVRRLEVRLTSLPTTQTLEAQKQENIVGKNIS